MATNKQLEQKVATLQKQIAQLSMTNSKLLDEVAVLKNNHSALASEVSKGFEVVKKRFQER
tara:strand:- start:325 stop:507 length:183 start_codon:yes stop_codon:yes gene_type:complete